MELKFLGRGSAFYPQGGNTSAYFIENNELFLIDCGSTVFWKMMRMNLLENIEKINVLITHSHTDHIGSLGTLIEYAYYKMKTKVNLILDLNKSQLENILGLLNYSGVPREIYNIKYTQMLTKKYETFSEIFYKETQHTKQIKAYSIIIRTKEGIVYYSGDTNDITYLKELIAKKIKINKIYIETTLSEYPGNVHLPLRELINNIPEKMKEKVYCMHLESYECIQKILDNGLNVVETEPIPQNNFSRRLIQK